MRYTIIASALVGLVLASTAAAQQQQPKPPARVLLTGVVADSLSGQPVTGATVTLTAAHRVTFTDSLGHFSIELARAGRQPLQVRQLGYATLSLEVDVAPGARPIRIALAPDPVALAEITARASRSGRYTIEGTVVDSATGWPLSRVVVWFRTSKGNAITDATGHFVYDQAQPGVEDVVVDVLGYRRVTALPRVQEPWQRLDFSLSAEPLVLQGIVAFAKQIRREDVRSVGVFKRILTEQEMAESHRATPKDFLVWSMAFPPPGPAIPCPPSALVTAMARPRTKSAEPSTGPLPPEAFRPRGRVGVIQDGVLVLGGDDGMPITPASDFYRAVAIRAFGCSGNNGSTVLLFTKAYLRRMLGSRPGVKVPTDSLEALVAAVDSLR